MRETVDRRASAGREGGRAGVGAAGRNRRRWGVAALAVVLLALVAFLGWPTIEAGLREQGAASVREAVLRAAAQCCAVEGSYPHTLSYLEEHYGLTVNRDDYAITYEAFASNVTPSVVVVPR